MEWDIIAQSQWSLRYDFYFYYFILGYWSFLSPFTIMYKKIEHSLWRQEEMHLNSCSITILTCTMGIKYISNLRVVLEIKILYIRHLANAQQMLLAFFQPQPLILLPMLLWFCVIPKSNNINTHLDYWEFLYLLRDSTNTLLKEKRLTVYCAAESWIPNPVNIVSQSSLGSPVKVSYCLTF